MAKGPTNKAAQLRLLGASLALGRFTAADLSEHTGLGLDTVNSWLRRHAAWFDIEPEQPRSDAAARGRPRRLRSLRPDAEQTVRARLSEAWRAITSGLDSRDAASLPAVGTEEYFASIDAAERKLEAAETVAATGMREHARQTRQSAQTWIRLAWQDLQDLASAGTSVPYAVVLRLARLERRAKGEDQASTLFESLAEARQRLVETVHSAEASGRPSVHACAVLRAQAHACGRNTIALLVGAALVETAEGRAAIAEPIIEGLTSDDEVIQHINALAQGAGLAGGIGRKEFRAIVNGLAVHSRLRSSWRIGQCIYALRPTLAWEPELAPAALRLMAEAPNTDVERLRDTLAPDLSRLFAEPATPSDANVLVNQLWEFALRVWRMVRPGNKIVYRDYWAGREAAA